MMSQFRTCQENDLVFFFAFPLLLQRFNQKCKILGHTGNNTHMQLLS